MKKSASIEKSETPQKCPEFESNFISQWIYQWVQSLVWLGYKKPLELQDLYELDSGNQAETLAVEFERIWNGEKRNKGNAVAVRAVLWRQFGRKYAFIGIFHLLQAGFNIGSPLIMSALITYIKRSESQRSLNPVWEGILYSFGFFLLQVLSTITLGRYFYHAMSIGMRVHGCLTAVIYRKTIKLSSLARQEISNGAILNIISSDLSRLDQAIWQGHYLWSGPLQILTIMALLIYFIGPVALAGFGLMILTIPLQGFLFAKLARLRRGVAQVTDKRIRLTQEFLQGMKIIKLFAWEPSLKQRAMDLRSAEVVKIRKLNVMTAILMGIATSVPVLAGVISFIIYALTGGDLSPAIIFPALAYFNMMRFPMIILPNAIRMVMESLVAFKRVDSVLNAEELKLSRESTKDPNMAIEIENGSFQWDVLPEKEKKDKSGKNETGKVDTAEKTANPSDKESTAAAAAIPLEKVKPANRIHLENINLKIKKGSLVAIVGPVGGGKSTLISAILGETKQVAGEVRMSGTVGYSLQQPWIQNGSLRKNVLFGNIYDPDKYTAAINATALDKDLEWLPAGSDTLLGEKGVQISGGQKARVSLARIVYCNPDIVLLDDPISAVDVHVGKHIFKHCIKDALREKTVLLATHHLSYVKQVDSILFVKDGKIEEQGTYEEIMASDKECAQLLRTYSGEKDKHENTDVAQLGSKADTKDRTVKKPMMEEEERIVGGVSWSVYKNYLIAAGGIAASVMAVFLIMFNQFVRVGTDVWLTAWIGTYFSNLTTLQYALIYLGWGLSQGLLAAILGSAFAFAFARASNIFHATALSGVFRSPITFFDLTPLGRIINRFSRDTDIMDNNLPSSIQMFINVLAGLIGTLILMIISIWWLIIPLSCFALIYAFLLVIYLRTSREIKRIESIARSPIFSHFSETMTGLSTIRAYNRQSQFINDSQSYIDNNNRAVYMQLLVQRWLAIRLEFIGSLICLSVALLSVATALTIPAALLGLTLTYSLQVTTSMNFVVRQAVDVEVNANSIERLNHYAYNLEAEAEYINTSHRPPTGWPETGKIEFKQLEIRYSKNSDPVVKGISLSILGKEKIAVVGRTGAGKSTITLALFRLLEASGGTIIIDGIDIASIGLHDLRQGLSIIPQDPILFSGTVRSNLDPFNQYSELDIWNVLDNVNMKEAIAKLDAKLESKVESNGENFSTGQRQLLCLARAMLKKPRILVMDEATANVDMKSDELIQLCLRRDFKESTIITIAHRLNTVIDYDRIVVLEQGNLAEFDTPIALAEKENGIFRKMIEQAGLSIDQIRKQAASGNKCITSE